jgi:DNA-binding protein HU-beta
VTKNELINKVADITGFTKKDSGLAVEAVFDAVTQALGVGEKVSVVGFGVFNVRERAGRTGRNPRTNKPMRIAARKVAVFKAGRNLKAAVAHK